MMRGVLRALCAGICFGVALLVPVSAQRLLASAPDALLASIFSAERGSQPGAPDQPVFRFGDAARPFGSSTVISDFNTDGEPDVAVADHVAGHASSYRLEFSISGQGVHEVTFESRHDALTIRVADVDRDDDLDVIVGTPLFGETIGVWLNDGHGHFTAGDVHQLAASLQARHPLATSDPLINAAALEVPPRRVALAMPAAFRAPPADTASSAVVRLQSPFRSHLPSGQTSPRAPPTPSREVSS